MSLIVHERLQFKEYLGVLPTWETLKCPEILLLIHKKKFMEVSPNLTVVLKIYLTGVVKSEVFFHVFLNDKVSIPELEETPNYSPFLCVQRYITKLVFVKMRRVRSLRKEVLQKGARWMINKKRIIFLWILSCSWFTVKLVVIFLTLHAFSLISNFVFRSLCSSSWKGL